MSSRWVGLILILLSITINIYFRLNSLFLSHLEKDARQEVYDSFREDLYKKISLTYASMPTSAREKLFDVLLEKSMKEKKAELNKNVSDKTKELKSYFQDEKGCTYLLEVDPYRWLRRVENFIDTGRFGTTSRGGEEYDDLMFAPLGAKVEPIRLHFYVGVYFYRLLHFINSKLSLMNCLAFIPLFLSIILVIAVFSFSILLGASYLGAFISSLLIGLAMPILQRSSFGWFDTDIYNIIFPLFIMFVIAHSFRGGRLREYYFLFLSGILMGVYSAIWSIWWLVFYILIICISLYKLEIILYDKQKVFLINLRDSLLSLFIFIFCSYLSVASISGFDALKKSFSEPLYYLLLRNSLTLDNFWPDIAFSISELITPSIDKIFSWLGGSYVLYGGIIGLLFLLISKKKSVTSNEKRFLILSLFIWLASTSILMRFGGRFFIFFIIPIGISFCGFWDALIELFGKSQNRIKLFRKINKKVKIIFLVCSFIVIILAPIRNASRVQVLPMVNDSWWKMLETIKKVTPQDAIINTVWDYGDYIMAITRRSTVYDPSWQYTPTTYWMSRLFLTQDEKEAIGILRMLNAGANRAFDELLSAMNNDKFKTIEIINRMLPLKKEEGRVLLDKLIKNKNKIDKILHFMYDAKRPAYVLLEQRMVHMMFALSTIGSWNFKKLDLWQKHAQLKENEFMLYATERLGYSPKEAQEFYNNLEVLDKSDFLSWVSEGRYQFYTTHFKRNIEENKNLIIFDDGLLLDKENMRAYYRNDFVGKWLIPNHLIFITKEGIKENTYKEGDEKYAVVLSVGDNEYRAILFSEYLAKSLFFKLYFLNGRGLEHFKLVGQESYKGYPIIFLYRVELNKQ
jgi:dolichyl-diphosphooligosaccharide--protein glycosyltransferase